MARVSVIEGDRMRRRTFDTVISVIRLPKWLPDYIDDDAVELPKWRSG